MARVEENFEEALLPAEYVPTLSEDLDLIGKIAITVIRDVVTKNHLEAFLKGRIDYGDTVEQAVVKLLESTAYDRDGENALAPDTAEKMAVRYFNNWSRKKFKTTIWTTEMKKYLNGEISAEDVAEKIISALAQSDTQELYEGINIGSENGGTQGLITYMRTDSLRISDEASAAAKDYITERFGENYYPASPRVYKTKASAQDAHEAIRPANIRIEPDSIKKYLSSDQYKLYKLIWSRFAASQMASAELETVSVITECAGYSFRTSGYTIKFPGYLAIYDDRDSNSDETSLPVLNEGDMLSC